MKRVPLCCRRGAIAHELVQKLLRVDYFLVAVGNGSSLLGPARAFKALGTDTSIVAYESVQSGVAFECHYPGLYYSFFGIPNGRLPRHRVFGTSYPGIDLPHVRIAYEEKLVHATWLVSDAEVEANYHNETTHHLPDLPRWDEFDTADFPYGRSTACGLAVAMRIATREKEGGKLIVVNAYDAADRYGS